MNIILTGDMANAFINIVLKKRNRMKGNEILRIAVKNEVPFYITDVNSIIFSCNQGEHHKDCIQKVKILERENRNDNNDRIDKKNN
jgi:hypothetical protein